MKLLDLCQLYFDCRDLYQIMNLSRQASEKEVRKAYHSMSLKFHPDRVEEDKKVEATEMFKVLGKIHSVLSDPEKRTIYDETGLCENEDDAEMESRDWMQYWGSMFEKVTLDHIKKYEDEYIGSDKEQEDIKKAYERCYGDMDKMMQFIMFYTLESEERIRQCVLKMIDEGELPGYDIFVNEPQAKRDRRCRKLTKEALAAAKEAKRRRDEEYQKDFDEEIEKLILAKRKGTNETYLSDLEKKYAGPKMSGKNIKKSSKGKPKK